MEADNLIPPTTSLPLAEASSVFSDILRRKPLRKKYATRIVLTTANYFVTRMPEDEAEASPILMFAAPEPTAEQCEALAATLDEARAMHGPLDGVIRDRLLAALKTALPIVLRLLLASL